MAALGLCCCARAFSSCGERGLLFVAVRRVLIAVSSLVVEHGLQTYRLQQFWLEGSRAQPQQLWRTGLVALRHVGSSRTRAQTRVPCIGRQILNYCTTREVLRVSFIPFIFRISIWFLYYNFFVVILYLMRSCHHTFLTFLFFPSFIEM